MLDWVENRFLARLEKLSLFLFTVYKLSQENTQLENMCNIVFEKVQGHVGKVNGADVFYAEGAIRRVLQKRFYENFPRIHKKTSVPESLF